MAAKKTPRPVPRERLATSRVLDDSPVARAVDSVAQSVERIEGRVTARSTLAPINLVVGDNVLNHNLGRRPVGAAVSPTVADPAFAWAMTRYDARQATIAVVGVDQPGAAVEFY